MEDKIKEIYPKATDFAWVNNFMVFRVPGRFLGHFEWSYAIIEPSGEFFYCMDSAILGALGRKYLGADNDFAHFAEKMLEIR